MLERPGSVAVSEKLCWGASTAMKACSPTKSQTRLAMPAIPLTKVRNEPARTRLPSDVPLISISAASSAIPAAAGRIHNSGGALRR